MYLHQETFNAKNTNCILFARLVVKKFCAIQLQNHLPVYLGDEIIFLLKNNENRVTLIKVLLNNKCKSV